MFILNETNYSDGKAVFYDNEGNAVSGGTLNIFRDDSLVSSGIIDGAGSASFSIDAGVFYRFEIVSSSGEIVSILDPVLYESAGGGPGEDYGERLDSIDRKLAAEEATRASADRVLQEGIDSAEEGLGQLSQFLEEERTARVAADYAHESRRDNPHEVTAHQVGAYTQQETEDRINDEATARYNADGEIINSLEDETTARRVNDELLAQQIEEVAVQTDWNESDTTKLEYLKNKPIPISDLEIEAMFI